MWVLEMSADEKVDEEEQQPEQPEEEEELSLEELKPKLYRMVYNNPTILLGMLEILFDLLEARGVMQPGEADTIITEGLRRWRDVVGPTQ
jgi:hypothetical protein